MRFRPCIDLHNGKVKQIVGGTLANDTPETLRTNYVSERSAEYYAEMFKTDQLTGGHIIMLGGGNERQLTGALRACPGYFHAGGGMNLENARHWLDLGAKKIIVSSYIFENGVFSQKKLSALTDEIGNEKLVIDVSCKCINGHYRVMTDTWRTVTDLTVDDATLSMLSAYGSEFLIHAVNVEGTGNGVEKSLIGLISSFDRAPITYAGGINAMADIEFIDEKSHGRLDFTVGSGLDIYGGSALRYDQLVRSYGRV